MPAVDIAVALTARTARIRSRWPILIAPGVVYLGIRVLGILVWGLMADLNHQTINLRAWDGNWYLAIAKYGYDGIPHDMLDMYGRHSQFTAMGFFPGYPWLIRAATALTGNEIVAVTAISIVAGVFATYGIASLVRRLAGVQAALIAVVLFSAAPMSIVYSIAYPEALLCAFSAWALVGVVERKWLLAGCCATAAGLVRPTGGAIIIVVVIAGALEVWRLREWRAACAALCAPIGLGMYLAWVGVQTASVTGYTQIQRTGWDTRIDGGWATAN